MNCAFDKEKLSGYYDGELDAAEKAEVERHIASCSECLRELGELKSAAILVKELPRLRAPRSIAEGVKKEIQAAGRVHSFARARRTLMWAASAAAVLFIGINLIYFTSQSQPAPTEVAARPPVSAAPVLGRAAPAEEAPPAVAKDRIESRRQADPEVRQEEARKNESADRDRKRDAAPLAKGEPEREKAFAGKVEEKKPTAVPDRPAPAPAPTRTPAEPAKPAPPPAVVPSPAPAAAPAAPKPAAKEEPRPAAEAPADKAVRKDTDGVAGVKQKAAEGPATDPAAAPGPMHLTLASTQMTKSRPEMTEALKRMGFTLLPPPSAAMVKGVARSGAREETAYMFELTDAQIARLRAELEKPGTSTLVTGKPEDPVMAQFKRGGLFEAKKDVASGGAPAKKPAADLKAEASKESDEFAAKKVQAEGTAEKTGEPRRKVVLHFLEVPYIPDRQPALDAINK